MDRWPEAVVEGLAERAEQGAAASPAGRRFIVAIAGGPAAGKSTLAQQLVQRLNTGGELAQFVPMDGFHMRNAELERRGWRHKKGAPETFDVGGYADCIKRLKSGHDGAVPEYSRTAHDVIDNAISVTKRHRIIVTEGNYLLIKSAPWGSIADLFDLKVFIQSNRNEAEKRLTKRHVAGGKTAVEAQKKIHEVDLQNLSFVEENSSPADYVISP